MVATFNFQYYTNPYQTEQLHYAFDDVIHQCIATYVTEVGKVIDTAETYQKAGYYVVIYLPYEAAKYYNASFEVKAPENGIYAACYVYKQPIHIGEDITINEKPSLDFTFTESKGHIQNQIRRIHQEIIEGETYQVNYTTRLEASQSTDIQTLYKRLTSKMNGHYTAMIDTEALKIASISPELFFQVGSFQDGKRTIVSKPMKGTMPRGNNKEEDIQNESALQTSRKDRAENVMIVDLLRNDITRIASPGTIRVPRLFDVERYPTVFQMTSMVTGEVASSVTLNDMLRALFPCGSITGAPKVNTMRIINELERAPRHIYCGALGLCLPDGRAVFNVPIRTIQYMGQKAIYGVGAGITIDSDIEQEYAEFKDKTKILEG
ncbi:aminodeoxychorismate synthase component I [Staphylococcus hyicus]|uniref:Aminodeoxychorismate synthase component I n=2 Tax=Staphylococcus hyicus TaxID=1284 RepID=A0ACD5FKY2_STAHY|nr:aminodeoxychorismate synthase component I [Staphylococcus hyicus]MCQ9290095.1 aminodeoxychorismate synthase component I [Staphylococcus hyicus]MCQ9305336.1 aminodeoxychorismate synthase component I [Staphylococcus hyicus]MCQ9307748.1 aminodeoxychorismate synthase component I [Staphylococcus hyicus]MCQ9310171.1 aminodeoxychorismate synthase component I [Staphylococcus hyicus]MDP4448836.1 aminodeoxychorismate synthase component I [Staphylococcus hyicus]